MGRNRTYTFDNAKPFLNADMAEDATWLDIPGETVGAGFEIDPGGCLIVAPTRKSEALPEVV
jgi:hypothetical protein